MWRFRENAQKSLKFDLKKIFDDVHGFAPSLAFGHICCGPIEVPGALRLSDIHLPEKTKSMLNEISDASGIVDHHNVAFSNHIQRFGRICTLLDWIVLEANDHAEIQEDVSISPAYKFYRISFQVSDDQEKSISYASSKGSCKICVSKKIFDILTRKDIIKSYFQLIYGYERYVESGKARYIESELLWARNEALRLAKENSAHDLKMLSNVYERTGNKKITELKSIYDWFFMGALQTGLIYTRYGASNNNGKGFATGVVVYEDSLTSAKKPISLISRVYEDVSLVSKLQQDICNILSDTSNNGVARFITDISGKKNIPKPYFGLEDGKYKTWNTADFEGKLPEDDIAVNFFQHWPMAIKKWLSLITETLRGEIHESMPLNFCMLLADISQIGDSKYFKLVPIEHKIEIEHNVPQLWSPWEDDGKNKNDVLDILNNIKRNIANSNYSWFQDGRYALLWDVTFPESAPRYLVKIVDSSWDVFVSNSRLGQKFAISDIALYVMYVRTDGSGGILCKGEPILSFQTGEAWEGEKSERKIRLTKILTDKWLHNKQNLIEKEVKKVVDASFAISEDPFMGAIIVLIKNKRISEHGKYLPFKPMGSLWETKDVNVLSSANTSELISLMAMDGATCIYMNEKHDVSVTFRRLLMNPNNDNGKKLDINVERELEGAGSRRWSAALGACHDDVELIIVISQDGPISIFKQDDNDKKTVIMVRI